MALALVHDLRNPFAQRPELTAKPNARFTLNGTDALELRLETICKEVLAGVQRIIPERKLEGIALGGGYGRGEGGVLKTPDGDLPYNDLEFYVLARGLPGWDERRYAKLLHALSAELSPGAGIELEFKITSAARLRHTPQSLFYHDLILGHRWLLGGEELFAGCEQHREAGNIPLSEATRLLMNRCSGLLFARGKLEHERFSDADADFVCRNLAKTELALGDAVLLAFGNYHWSCRERRRRMSDLSPAGDVTWLAEVRQRHAAGVKFKLQPHRFAESRAALQAQFRDVSALAWRVWLWLENRRLGCGFRTAGDYATSQINKWPETSLWRNLLANFRVFGPQALWIRRKWRHPRERILNALVLLLWGRADAGVVSVVGSRAIHHELLMAESVADVSAYRERWCRVG